MVGDVVQFSCEQGYSLQVKVNLYGYSLFGFHRVDFYKISRSCSAFSDLLPFTHFIPHMHKPRVI